MSCMIIQKVKIVFFSNRRNLIHNSPPLTQSFPDRHGNIMLKILKQPEAQHRARYMTEGSRGAVKDSQQQGHPVVQVSLDQIFCNLIMYGLEAPI